MSDRPEAPDPAPGTHTPPHNLASHSQGERPASILSALPKFLLARGELLGLETKEASTIVARQLILAVVALGAGLLTYLLLLLATGWTLHHLLTTTLSSDLAAWSVPLTALILAGAHLLIALILGTRARRKSAPPLFEYTRNEWLKDRAWLQKKTSQTENEH